MFLNYSIIITFKNDKLVSQINDTNKKQMLIEAASTMFNKSSIPVAIRLPQPGDNQIQKTQAVQDEPVREDAPAATQQETQIETKKENERIESDQEKMVLELFDGKFIE